MCLHTYKFYIFLHELCQVLMQQNCIVKTALIAMCASHGILNWVMSVGSSICKLVCVLFDELGVLAIAIPTFLMFLLLVYIQLGFYELHNLLLLLQNLLHVNNISTEKSNDYHGDDKPDYRYHTDNKSTSMITQ